MAVITLYACDVFPTGNVCPTPQNMIEFQIETDATLNPSLAEALNTHAIALDNNTNAMNDFFSLSTADVAQISALMLAMYITGMGIGRVVKMFRKIG